MSLVYRLTASRSARCATFAKVASDHYASVSRSSGVNVAYVASYSSSAPSESHTNSERTEDTAASKQPQSSSSATNHKSAGKNPKEITLSIPFDGTWDFVNKAKTVHQVPRLSDRLINRLADNQSQPIPPDILAVQAAQVKRKFNRFPEELKLPLPVIPSRPPYPAPWLSDKEVEEYLKPLYQRAWYVDHLPGGAGHQLVKKMMFSDYNTSLEFLSRVVEWTKKYGHEGVMTLDSSTFTYATHTHSAFRPDSEDSSDATSRDDKDNASSEPSIDPPIEPGLTLHDIRLALRIEQIWNAFFKEDKGVVIIVPWRGGPPKESWQPTSLSSGAYPLRKKKMKCLACRKFGHHFLECPDIKEIPPRKKCPHCKGLHWGHLCPTLTRKKGASQQQ